VLDTLRWVGEADGHLDLLDQTLLPGEVKVLALGDLAGVIDAIVRLAVRGAPAIGVAAAYGMVLGVRAAR
jgi:methylthioribose-1-phosphate isomerase